MIQVEEAYLNHLIYVSEHDVLTGVLNRYGLKKRINVEVMLIKFKNYHFMWLLLMS